MNKAEFKDLLRRYLKDDFTSEEKQLVEGWYDLMGEEKVVAIDDLEMLEERMWNNVQAKTLDKATDLNDETLNYNTLKNTPWYNRKWIQMAASLLFLVAIGSLWYSPFNRHNNAEEIFAHQKIIKNNNKNSAIYYLEDSSKVTLQPGGTLNIPIAFKDNDKREIHLSGEATFDVTRNINKPFLVHTGEIVTRVLGTSFKIVHSKKAPTIQVEVLTGKVSVDKKDVFETLQNKNNGVVLTPNQKVVYHADKQHFVTSVVDNPVLINSKQKITKKTNFVYEETPIKAIIEELEQSYGIKIVVDNDRFNQCPFTADLSEQPLFSKLEMITTSLNATYKVNGTTILITGRGCN